MKSIYSAITFIFLITQLINGQTIVAYYPFNGNANEVIYNNRNPKHNGATLTTDRFGNANSAYAFSGAANGHIDYVSTGLPTTNRTISLWFYTTELSSRPGLLSYGGNGCGTTFFMALNSSTTGNYPAPQYLVSGHCNTNNITYQYLSEPLNEWYHWVVTINGIEQKIYINGELKSTQNTFTVSTYTPFRELSFGVVTNIDGQAPYTDANLGYFNGKLDDIRIYDGALSESQVMQLYQSESIGLVSYYPFNGNANDESIYQNHGIVNSATLVSDRFGNSGNAYQFNGSSDYITIPNRFQNNLPSKVTLIAWAKRTRFGIDLILEKGGDWTGGTCNYGMGLHHVNNNMFYFFYNGGWRGTNGVNDYNWHHYAVVAENGNTNPKLYIDGVLKPILYSSGGGNISLATSSLDLHIGSQIGTLNYFGANIIDDVKIFGNALSDEEIVLMFENDSTCSDPLNAMITSPNNSGAGTLRAAIHCIYSGGNITWDPALDKALITAPIEINKNVNISWTDPASNPEIIIDFLNTASGFVFTANAELNLTNVDIKIRNYSDNKVLTQGNGTLRVSGLTKVEEEIFPLGTVHCNPLSPTEIVEVINPVTGRTWMDRNIGASQVATSSTDAAAYGDLYQWGRFADGHQCRNSGITDVLSSSDTPGHSLYIIINVAPYNWRSPQNNNLWQIPSNINNPCPVGYRVPTIQEFYDEINTWSGSGTQAAFNSVLKLPLAGGRSTTNGNLHETNNVGYYWTNDGVTNESHLMFFYQNTVQISPFNRGFGASVRCIKN